SRGSAHVRMVEFFGGAPALFVPDNLLSGVTKACRYEPDAICDRLIHSAYVIELQGPSLRETRARAQPGGPSGGAPAPQHRTSPSPQDLENGHERPSRGSGNR